MAIRAVFFDVGETLINEARIWRGWAEWLRVPHDEFMASLAEAIRKNQRFITVFERFRPGFDLAREQAARLEAGVPNRFNYDDLYPDAFGCLQQLKTEGYFVGIAGNQTHQAEATLREFKLPCDFLTSSASWGVEKPDPEFFNKVIDVAGVPAGEIAYVGDRVDNDVLPARAAGMLAVFLNRGIWGTVQATWPDASRAHLVLNSLEPLPSLLPSLGKAGSQEDRKSGR